MKTSFETRAATSLVLSAENDMALLLRLAKNSGLVLEADQIAKIKKIGNKIHFFGPDIFGDEDDFVCSTFLIDNSGTKGKFNSAKTFTNQQSALKWFNKQVT